MVDGMGQPGSKCPLIARYYCPWSRVLAREPIIGEKMSISTVAEKDKYGRGQRLVQHAFL